MPIMEIIKEGDPRLRQKATKVRKVDDDVRKLAQSMMETIDAMSHAAAVAAPQVGVLRRVIVIKGKAADEEDEEGDEDAWEPLMLANPEIVRSSGQQIGPEGCLSVPGWVGDVSRAMHITVKARDMNDKEVRIKASGYLARILQHEIDHLDGILFVDRVEDRDSLHYEPEVEPSDEPEGEPVEGPMSHEAGRVSGE